MRFHADSITITRRPDGDYDLIAQASFDGEMAQVTCVIAEASVDITVEFSVRQDFDYAAGIYGSVAPRAISYDLSIASPMVPDDKGIYYRQQFIGPCPDEPQ